jgi:helix-hairpin-helix protein
MVIPWSFILECRSNRVLYAWSPRWHNLPPGPCLPPFGFEVFGSTAMTVALFRPLSPPEVRSVRITSQPSRNTRTTGRFRAVLWRLQLHGHCGFAEFMWVRPPTFSPSTDYPPGQSALRPWPQPYPSDFRTPQLCPISPGRSSLFGYNIRPVNVASVIMPERSPSIARSDALPGLASVALIGVLFLAALALGLVFRPAAANLVRPDTYDLNVQKGIDPNIAGWFELAQLPGIGESLARKIISHRESRRAADPNSDGPIFESADKLLLIPGIGPRMMARIRPFLRFPPASSAFDSVSPNR